jgi:hypothetical protein
MNYRLAPVIAAMAVVTACGGAGTPLGPTTTVGSTTTVPVVSPAGNWSGGISDPVSGDGTLQLSLSDQAPNSLAGTWSATFKNGDRFSGPAVAGAPSGYAIILYVQNPPPPCETESGPGGSAPAIFTLINVVVTTSRVTAVSGRLSCFGPGVAFGTVNLLKVS